MLGLSYVKIRRLPTLSVFYVMLVRRFFCILSLCVSFLFLVSCSQELYSQLEEREANEMIAVLSRYNINADKIVSKDGYAMNVPSRYFADSVDILSAAGYPKRKYVTLNDLFGKSGLIPTPFEEHVRYIYGLSEELARTVALFDGVIAARVHIALPSDSTNADAKVSVFIKYDQQFDYDTLIPRVRKFISDSVERVVFENVEILALPGQKSADFYRIRRRLSEERKPLRLLEFILGGLGFTVVFVATIVWLYRRGHVAFLRRPSSDGLASLSVRQVKEAKSQTASDPKE